MDKIFECVDADVVRSYYRQRVNLLNLELEVQIKTKFVKGVKYHENKDDMSTDAYKIFEVNHEISKKYLEVDQLKLKLERLMFHKFCMEHGIA